MPVLVGNDIPEMSLNVSLDLVKSSVRENSLEAQASAIKKRVRFRNISSDISKFRSASQYKIDQISLRRKHCCFVEIAARLLLGFLCIVLVSGHETCETVPKNPYKHVLFLGNEKSGMPSFKKKKNTCQKRYNLKLNLCYENEIKNVV